MEKINEYVLNRKEWRGLLDYIDKTDYSPHGYTGMGVGTIDDGTSNNFSHCKEFSQFTQVKKNSSDSPIKLRVKDSDLMKCVDSYFDSLE
jgi:hypothetical protein